jgi:hypothetical protein
VRLQTKEEAGTAFPKTRRNLVKEKKQEPANIDASIAAAAEFRQKVDAAIERKVSIAKRIAEIDKSIVDKKNNRAAIRAIDKDPEKMIKELESEKKGLERQAETVKTEINNLHLERKNQLEADKKKFSDSYYERVFGPRELRVKNAESQLAAIFTEYAAAVVGTQFDQDSEMEEEEKQIDAEIDAFIKSASECGVPGNYKLDVSAKLGKRRAANAEDAVRKLNNKIKELTANFHKEVETAWKKKHPEQAKLLAEEVVRR